MKFQKNCPFHSLERKSRKKNIFITKNSHFEATKLGNLACNPEKGRRNEM